MLNTLQLPKDHLTTCIKWQLFRGLELQKVACERILTVNRQASLREEIKKCLKFVTSFGDVDDFLALEEFDTYLNLLVKNVLSVQKIVEGHEALVKALFTACQKYPKMRYLAEGVSNSRFSSMISIYDLQLTFSGVGFVYDELARSNITLDGFISSRIEAPDALWDYCDYVREICSLEYINQPVSMGG